MACKTPKAIDWDMLNGLYRGVGLLASDVDFKHVVARAGSKLVYLATPYSKEVLDGNGQWSAVRSDILGQEAAWWSAHLAVNGVSAISPIVQSAAMVTVDIADNVDPLDAVFWTRWCRPLLFKSDLIIIPPCLGWQHSRGVWHEAWTALQHNVPVLQIRAGSEFGGVS